MIKFHILSALIVENTDLSLHGVVFVEEKKFRLIMINLNCSFKILTLNSEDVFEINITSIYNKFKKIKIKS